VDHLSGISPGASRTRTGTGMIIRMIIRMDILMIIRMVIIRRMITTIRMEPITRIRTTTTKRKTSTRTLPGTDTSSSFVRRAACPAT